MSGKKELLFDSNFQTKLFALAENLDTKAYASIFRNNKSCLNHYAFLYNLTGNGLRLNRHKKRNTTRRGAWVPSFNAAVLD